MPEIANSSTVVRVEHDEAAGVLSVWFRSRVEPYRFAEVPRDLYDEFLAAVSPGSFFHQRIKGRFDAPGEAA